MTTNGLDRTRNPRNRLQHRLGITPHGALNSASYRPYISSRTGCNPGKASVRRPARRYQLRHVRQEIPPPFGRTDTLPPPTVSAASCNRPGQASPGQPERLTKWENQVERHHFRSLRERGGYHVTDWPHPKTSTTESGWLPHQIRQNRCHVRTTSRNTTYSSSAPCLQTH